MVYQHWNARCTDALWLSFFAMGALDFFLLRKTVGPKVPKFFKPLYFVGKYIGVPMLSFKAMDRYLDIETDFVDCAKHYNFGYEDFEAGLAVFEKAKIVNKLDLLLEQRGEFDMSQLDGIDLDYAREDSTVIE